ncbi:NADPh quinone reductase [Gryganskiella cystojenkinii]|nr:NADPh quinone reductase [Gryganskiella cystojenkinii]
MTPTLPSTMKAVQWTCPNKNRADQLTFNESAPVPVPTGSQILIKVHASAINPIDWKIMKGGMLWHLLPKYKVPGSDVAGTVVAFGPNVGKPKDDKSKDMKAGPKFQIGDEVMTMLDFRFAGALQEYAIVDEALVTKKPVRWTFEQAAAYPMVATTVWLALVGQARIKKGDRVLINGASGGTGTVGVQVAKALGAHVVGVCSTANIEMVKATGADQLVDYKTTDVTQVYRNQDFDIIFDTVGPATEIWANRSTILKPTGSLVRIVGPDNAMDTPFHLLATSASNSTKKLTSFLQSGPGYHFVSTMPDGQVLRQVIDLLDRSGANPVIDSVNEFSLPSTLAILDKSESGRAKGKILVRIA